MAYLSVSGVKRPCNLAIEIRPSMDYFDGIIRFVRDRKMLVEEIQYHNIKSQFALVYLHCHIEHHLERQTMDLIGKLEGVIKIEKT